MASLELRIVHPLAVRTLEPQVFDWLRCALMEDPRCSMDGLLGLLESSHEQLWLVERDSAPVMVLVSRVVQYEKLRSFEIRLCAGGELRECLELLPQLEEAARQAGCRFVEVHGRRGWERALPGYRFRAVQLEKEL